MTQQAIRTRPAAPVHPAGRVPGEPGVWVFILTEMAIFTALFGVIVWNRAHQPEMFAAGSRVLSQPLGLVNTVVLIVGSVLVVLAIDAMHADRFRQASRYLGGAMATGLFFMAVKAVEYHSVIDHGMWIHTNAFWMIFFAVTGAHLLHVLVGTTTLGLMRARTASGLTGPRDRELFISATCYWHMVDLLWLVLFPLFYLVN
ncbi:cytochrome c oxidase subunit 3 [Mycobacterium sp. CVI_P3]|uniref:Probable cytochrome c oxidase subunit 3 n=1 Tax=Mycobacterium pinniadriaticum TaxID=2994102 RepID=A0ABT3SCA8_9MYCO|nr:cytochrome c oxidase subunit 3 [Mycobacterium pinniadriaticum]MCX2930700.1 cytochrome c oxidase subunit 3 [Mycobacterium pinniadriaticum]MCX2937124.1 cytochrome c oxidase subunit 3 [Mycobacterium pinniadriaticum]